MATPAQNSALTSAQQRLDDHAQRLTHVETLLDEMQKNLVALTKAATATASVVTKLEARDEMKAHMLNVAIPLIAAIGGAMIGHFWH